MAVARAAVGTGGAAGPAVPSLSLTSLGEDSRSREHRYHFNSNSAPLSSFRRTSLPPLPSPRLLVQEEELAPPVLPLTAASASTTDLHEGTINPILSSLQRRATVRQTRSNVNMRFSMSAVSSSSSPSPVGVVAGSTGGTKKSLGSRSSSPAMGIERKPVPSPQMGYGSLGRKNKLRPSSLSQSPTIAPPEGFPRLGTPPSATRGSPQIPFSAHSTPALAQTPSWASLPQPSEPPHLPFLERSKTPPAILLRTGFGSPSRRKNVPERINTNFSGDEAMGMTSFFSPISSDEDEKAPSMRLPKRTRSGEAMVGPIGAYGPRPGSRKTSILFLELTGGGKDGVEGKHKKEKKDKKEVKEGGRRRVSGFGAGSFRKFWGGKDDSEPKSPGLPKSPGFPVVPQSLPVPNPPFLSKAANRASSPSPFLRRKKEKEEKKDKKEKEIVLPKETNIVPNSTFSGRVKISHPIPHPDLLQAFPSPTSPKYPPGTRPRGSSLSYLSTALPQPPPLHYPMSASSSSYSQRTSSDMNAPSMTSFTSNSTGPNHRSSPLSPGGIKTVRHEDQLLPLAAPINVNQYGGASVVFPPSPPYTGGESNLRLHNGHVRSVSAPSISLNPPRNSIYDYNSNVSTTANMIPAGAGWKFPAPSQQTQQQYEQSLGEAGVYSPGSAQDLLHTLHQALAIVERKYAHSISAITKEISLDERLAQEFEALEKRLRSQTEIIAGIRRQVGERKRRVESKLRREREAEMMAAVKEHQSESERSYFNSSSSEDEGDAEGADHPHTGGGRNENEHDQAEEGVSPERLAAVTAQEDFMGVGRGRPLTNVDEEGDADLVIKTSSHTNAPTRGTDDHSPHCSSSIPRPSAIQRADTNMSISSASPKTPTRASPTGTPVHSRPPSRSNSSLILKRTSNASRRRRPAGSLARRTFGEEQRKNAIVELMTNATPPEGMSRATSPAPASGTLRLTLQIQAPAPAGLGLGTVAPNNYINVPAPRSGLQSSSSSFSFESSDVEKAAVVGCHDYHHAPLSAAPSHQPSRETLGEQNDGMDGEKGKEDKAIHALRQKLDEKRGQYLYHQQSANTTSTSLHLTSTSNSGTYPPPPHPTNTYPMLPPQQPQQPGKPTSGHIHFPSANSNNNSRSNSRANTPIPFSSHGGLISPPISPPASSHGNHGGWYRRGGEEVVRERAISPEGILMRSQRAREGEATHGFGPGDHERKAVVEGVELMLI